MARKSRLSRIDAAAPAWTGDSRNMAALSRSRPRDKAWYAWNGDIKLKRSEGRIEPVIGGVDMQQEGRYGTQTPPEYDHLHRACPGLNP